MKKLFFILSIITLFVLFIFYFSYKSEDKIVLRFSSWGSKSEVDIINSVISDFEKNNKNVRIEFLHIPQNYFQKLHLLFASNLEPDVIFLNNHYIQMYIKAGLLENLSDYFIDLDKTFYKTSLNSLSENGYLYAVPRDISNLVIYYNKDIFKENGIDNNIKLKTIHELKNLALKLTNENHYGLNYEEDTLYLSFYLAANGAGFLSDDKKSMIIGEDNSLNTLNLYSDFINEYHIMPSKSEVGSMTSAQMFLNGKLAMYISGRWMVPKFREAIKFDWDIMMFPSCDQNKVYVDASGWAISKKSKNKDMAIKFINYLSSKQTIEKFTESGLIVPARIDVSQSDVFLAPNQKPKNSMVFVEMLKYAKPTPINENYNSINDIINEKLKIILSGSKSAEEVFDENTIKRLEKLL